MKSFNYKALATAAAAACGATAAFAGTVSSTPIAFATEAVTNTSPVTAGFTYTMGVGRVAAQNFTFIVKVPSAAVTFSGTCPSGANATGSGGLTLAVKRQSATECAYDVTPASNIAAGNTITIANLVVTNHALGSGSNLTVMVNLADPGETARIDNSADVPATLGTSTSIVSLTATADTHTTADVNFNSGNSPLFGFVAGLNQTSTTLDTANTTYANFSIGVATGYVIADGVTAANASNTLNNVTVTVAGDYSGLVTAFGGAGNSSVALNNAGVTVNPTTTYNANTSAASFTVTGAQLNATGNTAVEVGLVATGNQSLGISRVFGVSAVARPIVGGTVNLAGNAGWWTWKANAVQLATAFFNNDNSGGNLTRFFFQNTGAAASYSATCYAESGLTVTYGAAKTGTLTAQGTTPVNAADICTFSTGKRGSIVFTINSAVGKVKGVYQQAINGAAAGYIPLERPYGVNGTSNGANY